MITGDLIDSLSSDVKSVGRGAVGRQLVLGIVAGVFGSLVLVFAMLGIRADLTEAIQSSAFWMKWGYSASLAVAAIYATLRFVRPEPGGLGRLWLMALPVAGLAIVAAGELVRTPRSQWLAMWLGQTWSKCPELVLMLAIPIFAGLLWSSRRMAPTQLRAAGTAAGLAAGAIGATLYCLHCPEVSALFVLTWYSLGIVLTAGIGALIGPRLLRW